MGYNILGFLTGMVGTMIVGVAGLSPQDLGFWVTLVLCISVSPIVYGLEMVYNKTNSTEEV